MARRTESFQAGGIQIRLCERHSFPARNGMDMMNFDAGMRRPATLATSAATPAYYIPSNSR